MPFVQRVVQPVNLAQVCVSATGGNRTTKFLCIPGKCKNNNCINNKQLPPSASNPQLREESLNGGEQKHKQAQEDILLSSRTLNNNNNSSNVKDNSGLKSPSSTSTSSSSTTTITTAIIHNSNGLDLSSTDNTDHSVTIVPHSNGFASSFSYNTDHEDDGVITPVSPAPAMPMKKLKQHVEFLSTVPSPTRSHTSRPSTASGTAAIRSSSHQRLRSPQTPQTPTSAKIVAGYEFDSISNITLSNALRQLASLVLIASDIFDDLQRELQTVGDRARVVQKKIVAVERRVSAYDPKTVTVPESDLLTFAQRKQHYDCDKSYIKELFTADTRPRSVRALYEDAGKVTPPPTTSTSTAQSSAAGSPIQFASGHVLGDGSSSNDGMLDMTNAGGINHHHHLAAGSDDLLLCSSAFGVNTNRQMCKRIDAEIEIRLPAAIEDLRKWTSSEALGDVTVTPDCMHHVDTSISTSVCIGDNGILTPALSPSVLSADAVDALYSINVSNTIDNSQIPNDINKDVPLNHRLPSPEEQCKIIALRYPAEVISVDTSGKRFQRMCMARKSTTGVFTHMPDTNNLNEDVQTVSRRSRSRKARGKRRNTIAGIDQKEIQDAANGDSTATSGELKNALASAEDGNGDERSRLGTTSKKFGRSKSSDILKKESVALPYDKGKNTLTRLNSLKQWGRNRFKFMQRNNGELTQQHTSTLSTIDSSGCSNDLNTSGTSSHNSSTEKAEVCSASGSASGLSNKTSSTAKIGEKSGTDVDEDCRVHDMITQRTNESRFSHERKPSYSSSEKSMSVSSSGHLRGKLHLNSVCANVKLRDTSSLNRQRRINGLGSKDDQPHSSSGNWSASSESGRASIGSEITLQPKSSASNTSLNVSSFHNGSAPPSSMLSRRRFFNTSASSSVTSEGTATPDLQINANNMEGTYPNHLDDETSSAYSCDTEGYYTSFHMDSGLRTLKEEEFNMSNFQIGGQPFNASFGQSQLSYNNNSQQTLMAENEYELFGRGSTSTTTSSAGTVCTTLMAHNSGAEQSSLNNSLASCGPEVPERISSLRHSTASTSTLERSISSSTIGSTLERTGTIKRNVNASLKLTTCSDGMSEDMQNIDTPESQEEEFNYSEQMKKRQALPLPPSTSNEIEYSESSDLEGVERIERMRQKTALNAKRIPSMCIITPSTSDDENQALEEQDNCHDDDDDEEDELNKTLTEDSFKDLTDIEEDEKRSLQEVDNNLNHVKASVNMSLMNKLKVVLPNIRKSPSKALASRELTVINDDELYDMAGEYVYISADVSNNNKKALQSVHNMPKASANTGLGIYYSNNVLNRLPKPTEYVSLNELPRNIQKAYAKESQMVSSKSEKGSFNRETQLQEQRNKQGAESQFIEETKQNNLPTMTNAATTTRAAAATIPMYAEINELRSEIAASASTHALSYLQNTPPSSAASSPHVSPHKGARVRLNAQGKPIYDSDSLKRRKGAHTTFAPGPYVKRQQDTVDNIDYDHDYKEVENESIDTTVRNTTSESVNPAAKLLLLNKSNANPRKIANVRPIINKSHLQRPLPSTPVELQLQQQLQQQNTANEMSGFYMTSQYAVYNKDTGNSTSSANNTKHLLANGTNPHFHQQSMHSPSTKSTASSTGSTISSTTSSSLSSSTTTTTQSGSSKDDEGYQHLYKTNDEVDSYYETLSQKPLDNTGFPRNTPVYWTLQNRRPVKPQPQSVTSRDDLYATPIKRSERLARAQQQQQQLQEQQHQQHVIINKATSSSSLNTTSSLSPVVQRNRTAFLCSTPLSRAGANSDSQLPADNIPAKQRLRNWDDNSPDRLNTCADRIGQSKTSLMDFKRLLLAKSVKTSTVPKKISAVELLKKTNNGLQSPTKTAASNPQSSSSNSNTNGSSSATQLNSSMKLLDLSGSPKTFANRRMLRQGQFGSPSKTFVPKMKSSPANNWRSNSVQRTDIMSTTIPEANSEEDHSGNSSLNTSTNSSTPSSQDKNASHESLVDTDSLNLKRNIFLQTEENNFMRGELRSSFTRSKADSNKYVTGPMSPLRNSPQVSPMLATVSASISTTTTAPVAAATAAATAASISNMPALETAL
ncbi:serine-rich adhesin for platelets [Calliphora vicina]|uniref:serine-rich adhesin for platelets n=1 Tax=Calliphora vicina TaxID=7373 RepID=UPI00325A7A45